VGAKGSRAQIAVQRRTNSQCRQPRRARAGGRRHQQRPTIHPKGIQVTDDSGNPLYTASYPYELLTGTPANWMQVVGGTSSVQWIEANVVAYFTYNKVTTSGASTITDTIGEHMHTCRVKLINTASGIFSLSQLLNTGEAYPPGLAQSIYNSLATLQYNFTHTILESPFITIVKPGKHSLNLSGAAIPAAWATMNAMIQSVEMELIFTPSNGVSVTAGVTTAKTTVNCGPVQHLEAGELVQLFNLFANRDLSKINPGERSSSASLSGGQVTLGADSPKENSVPAPTVDAVKNFVAPDAVTPTLTNLITPNPASQTLTFTQNKADGTQNTQVGYPRIFSGNGAPSNTTLVNGIQYQAGTDFYYDASTPTAPVGYLCTTSGNYNVGSSGGSVWAKITGGGASGGWNYRGAWTAGTYNTNDVVSLGSGTSAGMYLSLIDTNTNTPDSGIGWVQISTSAGTWL